MEWKGGKIRELAKQNKISLAKLSEMTGVSRQTVNGWINGQIPKGNHLITLCGIFNISPEIFFSDHGNDAITVPAHRARRRAKITPTVQKEALNLAKEYALLFRNDMNSDVLPVIRIRNRDTATVRKIATKLRAMSDIPNQKPMDVSHTFTLMEKLGIKVIFRYFPDAIKAYAFYTKIFGHRVVFVNNHTNVLDLIFPLIHEAVHAVRDEIQVADIYDEHEEKFCDEVANHVQFPDEYVQMVYETVHHLPKTAYKVNTLKTFGKNNGHALYGIANRIKNIDPEFDINIGGVDTNLKKKFKSIGDILFSGEDPRSFLNATNQLSPLFMETVTRQADILTTGKIGELFGVEGFLDADGIKKEISLKDNNLFFSKITERFET